MSETTPPPSTDESDLAETLDHTLFEAPDILVGDYQHPDANEEEIESADDSPPETDDSSQVVYEDAVALMQNTASGMDQFFGQSYSSPEVARSASQSLIESFDDRGLWLASLVQPRHLVSELRQQCAMLTSMVITQWVRQGETHKLKMLGEVRLAEPASEITHDSGQIMVMLADLLGILRPQTAQCLLEAARPHLWDNSDLSMIRQAQQWVDVGRLLETSGADERIFWNRRLREPRGDWDWESADARMALQKLGRLLPKDGSGLQLIQHTVPGCWWDLWRDQPSPEAITTISAAPTPPVATAPATRKKGSFTLGLLLGILGMGSAGWFYFGPLLDTLSTTSSEQASAQPVTQPPVIEATPVDSNEPPAPPIRDSLYQLRAVLKMTPELAAATSSSNPAKPPANAVTSTTTTDTVLSAKQEHPKKLAREKERLNFAQKHPELKRLYNLTRSSSLREDNGLVQGQSSVAPLGSQLHQDLLRMLILDPPEQAEMRLTSAKLALRSLPTPEVITLFDLCLYPDSPNEIEIKQCVSLLLDLPADNMTEAQRKQLQAMASGS